MEFLFELLLEIFGEALLQVVFGSMGEAGQHLLRNPEHEPRERSPWVLGLGYALLGALAGAISLLLLPHGLIRHPIARFANLLLSPLAAGLSAALLGAWRRRRGQQVLGLDRFVYGFAMGLAMAGVRYAFTD